MRSLESRLFGSRVEIAPRNDVHFLVGNISAVSIKDYTDYASNKTDKSHGAEIVNFGVKEPLPRGSEMPPNSQHVRTAPCVREEQP